MKRINILVVLFMVLFACKDKSDSKVATTAPLQESYASFGNKVMADEAISTSDMAAAYETIKTADSLPTTFKAEVREVCKAKGCWMKLTLDNGQEAMVRFKDYGFFVPTDIEGKEVIVNGLAFISEMAVEEQQHYAKDAGATAEEIAQITTPKRTLGFEADGVLVKK